MAELVTATTVKAWLGDELELAFIDVREHGQYGHAHPLFVSSVPFSVFENRLPVRVPNRTARVVLLDNGDDIGAAAAARAQAMGYSNVFVLDGGAPAWAAAGYTLYAGVNVPSKAFAELMELARHTPSMPATEVAKLKEAGVDHVILDGRPLSEFHKMSIPGARCCPNGELALRIDDIVRDENTTIIINCAGRTRSIIGAQTLIDAGISNPVFALENGTQGWVLAGLTREHDATAQYDAVVSGRHLDARRASVRARAQRAGVSFASADQVSEWLGDVSRTTYLLDVRTPEEFARDGLPQAVHAPGGQLVQGTDEWISVRGARVVLMDNDMVRAPMTGYWLAQMGHSVFIAEGGVQAMSAVRISPPPATPVGGAPLSQVSASELHLAGTQLVDLRASMAFRRDCIDGARWTVRSRITQLNLDSALPVVLIGDAGKVLLVAKDLLTQGYAHVSHLLPDVDAWRRAGLPVTSSVNAPRDEDCIDFLFFTAERHTGNEAHSRQYLDWEINLVNQLDTQERSAFHVNM